MSVARAATLALPSGTPELGGCLTLVSDLDDVVYGFDGTMRAWMLSRGHVERPVKDEWDMAGKWGVTQEQLDEEMAEAVLAGHLFWRGPALERAPEVLRSLREEGHTVHFATARYGPRCEEATAYWLDREGIEFDGLTFTTNKASVPGHIYLEDAPHNIEDIRRHGRRAVAFDQRWNRHVPGDRVRSWTEFGDLVRRAVELRIAGAESPTNGRSAP